LSSTSSSNTNNNNNTTTTRKSFSVRCCNIQDPIDKLNNLGYYYYFFLNQKKNLLNVSIFDAV
jgi:hypothetical protein